MADPHSILRRAYMLSYKVKILFCRIKPKLKNFKFRIFFFIIIFLLVVPVHAENNTFNGTLITQTFTTTSNPAHINYLSRRPDIALSPFNFSMLRSPQQILETPLNELKKTYQNYLSQNSERNRQQLQLAYENITTTNSIKYYSVHGGLALTSVPFKIAVYTHAEYEQKTHYSKFDTIDFNDPTNPSLNSTIERYTLYQTQIGVVMGSAIGNNFSFGIRPYLKKNQLVYVNTNTQNWLQESLTYQIKQFSYYNLDFGGVYQQTATLLYEIKMQNVFPQTEVVSDSKEFVSMPVFALAIQKQLKWQSRIFADMDIYRREFFEYDNRPRLRFGAAKQIRRQLQIASTIEIIHANTQHSNLKLFASYQNTYLAIGSHFLIAPKSYGTEITFNLFL